MTEIQSLEDLKEIWPENTFFLKAGGSEYGGPCPFCPAEAGDTLYKTINGVIHSFVGTDRFFVWTNTMYGYCRFCAARGDGIRGMGRYSMRNISDRLGFTVAKELKPIPYEEQTEDPLSMLWYDAQVIAANERVDYAYWWNKCRWGRDLVDEFQLGWGTLYVRMGPANILPMRVQKAYEEPIDGWYIAARQENGAKERSPGSSRNYFWFVERDRDSRTVILCESEKNNITHTAIGYENSVATFGAGNKNKKILEYLWSLGYRHLILAGDNDQAGRDMNERFGNWANNLRFDTVQYIDWPTDFREGGDTTDLMAYFEGDTNATLIQFEEWLTPYEGPKYDETIETAVEIVDLSDLRSTGPNSIYGWETNFIDTYAAKRRYGRGRLLLLAVPPGAGKTHTSVRVVEERARVYLEKRNREKEAIEQQVRNLQSEYETERNPIARDELSKAIQKLGIKLEDWSVQGIGWFGQYINQWADLQRIGIDESLWYNYEARNVTNCGNYDTVTQLGQNHHNIGAFCKNGCPLRDMCRKNGYLAQDEERKKKPIIFFRHGNLPQHEMISDCRELILIDENPTALFEQYLSIHPADLYAFYPDRESFYAEDQDYQSLTTLMSAVRAAMSANAGAKKGDPNWHIYGASFMRLVEQQLGLYGLTLSELIDGLRPETLDTFQPNFLSSQGGEMNIRLRCVPDLVKSMQRELSLYTTEPNNQAPSCIHLVSGQLIVFAAERLNIPSSIPVIVADGTALPQLYEAMFNREVELYRPEIRNPNCHTIVIGGSDFLKSVFNREVGHIVNRIKRAEKRAKEFDIDIDELPIDESFESKFMEEATILIKGLAEEHAQLLVISYKDLRLLLEGHLEKIYPHLKGKIAWGHYGAMRGTNMYEDYPAVLLIGAFRIPYDAAYLYISMWATLLGVTEKIDEDTIVKTMKYDGQDEGYEYRTFSHPLADAYVNAREQAEMRQSVERIRPHATQAKKFVYAAAGRPFLRAVNEVIQKKKFLDRYRVTKTSMLLEYHRKEARKSLEMFGSIRFPAFRTVRDEFHTSYKEITAVRQQVLSEFNQLTDTDIPV